MISPDNYPLTHSIYNEILNMRETGFFKNIYDQWMKSPIDESQTDSSSLKTILNLKQMSLVFIIFLGLVVFSVIILIIEKFINAIKIIIT